MPHRSGHGVARFWPDQLRRLPGRQLLGGQQRPGFDAVAARCVDRQGDADGDAGALVPRRRTTFADIRDGLSGTILLAEIATDLGDRDVRTDAAMYSPTGWDDTANPAGCATHPSIDAVRPGFWDDTAFTLSTIPVDGPGALRGMRWADGNPIFTVVQTMLPPNSPICFDAVTIPDFGSGQHTVGYYGASSRHVGGVHVAMADGAVRFMTDSVDCGNTAHPMVQLGSTAAAAGIKSPYGVWGAMGTRASGEVVE